MFVLLQSVGVVSYRASLTTDGLYSGTAVERRPSEETSPRPPTLRTTSVKGGWSERCIPRLHDKKIILKNRHTAVFRSIFGLVWQQPTFESRENTTVSAVILGKSICLSELPAAQCFQYTSKNVQKRQENTGMVIKCQFHCSSSSSSYDHYYRYHHYAIIVIWIEDKCRRQTFQASFQVSWRTKQTSISTKWRVVQPIDIYWHTLSRVHSRSLSFFWNENSKYRRSIGTAAFSDHCPPVPKVRASTRASVSRWLHVPYFVRGR